MSLHFTLACITRSKHSNVFICVWVTKKLSVFFLFCFDVHMYHTADTNSVSRGEYVTCYSGDHNDYNKKLKFYMCFRSVFTYVGVTETRAIDLSKPTLATTNLSFTQNITFTSIVYWLITLNFLFDKQLSNAIPVIDLIRLKPCVWRTSFSALSFSVIFSL